MSGSSSVGNAAVYEAGDQRNAPASQKQDDQAERYEEGKEHSHKENDSKDERSIANRLAAAHDQNDPNDGSGKKKTAEQIAGEHDPTAPAKMHGNEPSRGAKIDKAIEDEEAELLRRKDESQNGKTL
ncbi:hypothetical protein M406DRAFT_343599 [Cryphonectria parasitica EP155]|uniref:Uncharacterized protein n=1 Tax=Cryphonectria parasitica (strain ATCC 38755 / EP155) TaxID=660469 RepID=A0A9P5CHG4_CRYP1|nr:uncharacterized protein M406DRAFT_343599 [Cryphonectria parasitica EP155]KAF3759963.1 hypothetical protein M406DRAFT_343599 [Cryphonectria parasitica EP155]